jgi:hypothetical protein
MKTFRQTLFFVIAVLMLTITIIEFAVAHPSHAPFDPLRDGIWLASPFAMLAWCASCLKLEPSLAQAGIISVIFYFALALLVTAT